MTDTHRHPTPRVFRALRDRPFAITQPALEQMLEIAARKNLTVEAVEAMRGEKLENTRQVTLRDGVATIPVRGPIVRYGDSLSAVSGATSTEAVATDFQAALGDPAVRSILLEIDSPGGEANGTSELADMIFQARGTKPVAAYIGGQGCSAAYWLASAADQIVIADTALAGSIGVVMAMQKPDAEDGEIEFVSSQSPKKRVDPTTEEGRTEIQTLMDDMANVFIGAVARNRGVTPETVLSDFGQGGVFVGQKAVDAGLADAVGTQEGLHKALVAQSRPKYLSFVPKSAAKPAAEVTPKQGVPRMGKLKDFLRGSAEAAGYELDEEDEQFLSASSGFEAATSEIAQLKAELAAREAELTARAQSIDELVRFHEAQQAQIAAAARAQRDAEAAAAARTLANGSALSAEAVDAFAALVVRVQALESGDEIEAEAPTGLELVEAFAGLLPDASLFTAVQVPDDAKVLAAKAKTPGVQGKEEVRPEVLDKILASTDYGRKILAERAKRQS